MKQRRKLSSPPFHYSTSPVVQSSLYILPTKKSEDIPGGMSEDMPDKISEDMPEGMPDRYAR